MLNNWLAEKAKDYNYLVYVRRFQPFLRSDVARIIQLFGYTNNIIIAVIQICHDPQTEHFEDSFNHPALNPFSYWENCVWINSTLSKLHASTAMVMPCPWYQYQLSADELNSVDRRLWLADRLETYLPTNSLFCTENDDPMLINFLQEEIGTHQIKVFNKYAIDPFPHFVAVQRMMIEGFEWQNYVADVLVQTGMSIRIPRIRTLWQKYGELDCTKPYQISEQSRRKINMEKNDVIEIIDQMNKLHKQVVIPSFSEKFPEDSKAIRKLIVNEVAEFRTILGELERLEEKDIYGKDPTYAQDRFSLNSRLQKLSVRMELEVLPELTNKLIAISISASKNKMLPEKDATSIIGTLKKAMNITQKLTLWVATLVGNVVKIVSFFK